MTLASLILCGSHSERLCSRAVTSLPGNYLSSSALHAFVKYWGFAIL